MIDAHAELARAFAARAPASQIWSLRLVDQWDETLSVRQGIPVPPRVAASRGALVRVVDADGVGYAATGDLSVAGLLEAARRARGWAKATAGRQVAPSRLIPRPDTRGRYETPCAEPWEDLATGDKLALLQGACAALKVHDAVVDWEAWLGYRR
ncbi:MAG: TldD/PmbA family protein, partial [Chromatiales bacterium]